MASTSRTAAGQTLRAWRLRRRLSQLELASRTGVSTRHLSCLETGKANASRQLLLYTPMAWHRRSSTCRNGAPT